ARYALTASCWLCFRNGALRTATSSRCAAALFSRAAAIALLTVSPSFSVTLTGCAVCNVTPRDSISHWLHLLTTSESRRCCSLCRSRSLANRSRIRWSASAGNALKRELAALALSSAMSRATTTPCSLPSATSGRTTATRPIIIIGRLSIARPGARSAWLRPDQRGPAKLAPIGPYSRNNFFRGHHSGAQDPDRVGPAHKRASAPGWCRCPAAAHRARHFRRDGSSARGHRERSGGRPSCRSRNAAGDLPHQTHRRRLSCRSD